LSICPFVCLFFYLSFSPVQAHNNISKNKKRIKNKIRVNVSQSRTSLWLTICRHWIDIIFSWRRNQNRCFLVILSSQVDKTKCFQLQRHTINPSLGLFREPFMLRSISVRQNGLTKSMATSSRTDLYRSLFLHC